MKIEEASDYNTERIGELGKAYLEATKSAKHDGDRADVLNAAKGEQANVLSSIS